MKMYVPWFRVLISLGKGILRFPHILFHSSRVGGESAILLGFTYSQCSHGDEHTVILGKLLVRASGEALLETVEGKD